MSTSNISVDLCAIKQSVRINNTFAEIVYSTLVVKKF